MLSKKIVKLIEHGETLQRGDVIRCIGTYPYEDYVDFMLIEYPFNQINQYALLVDSGYKAGLIFVVWPEQANNKEGPGVNIDWLKINWSKWGYIDCPLEDVYVFSKAVPKSIYD